MESKPEKIEKAADAASTGTTPADGKRAAAESSVTGQDTSFFSK